MNRKLLRNDQWEGIKDLLPGKKGDPGKTGGDKRLLIEAVLCDCTDWVTLARPASCLWQLEQCVHAVLPLGKKRGLETFAGTGLR